MKKCLPCAVHYRRPLKEILEPLIETRHQEIDDSNSSNDVDYDRACEKAYEKFNKALYGLHIESGDLNDAIGEYTNGSGVYEIYIPPDVRDEGIYVRKLE